jgi:ankyrin repeat protein
MFCLVLNRSWAEVIRRSAARPRDMLVQDSATGNTLMHEACRRDPPVDVIGALAALSRTPNFQGATPLHMAASHRCRAGALRALLELAAATVRPSGAAAAGASGAQQGNPRHYHHPTADLSSMGRAPIHYACMSFRGLDMEAFLLLLDETLKHGNRDVRTLRQGRGSDKLDDLESRDDENGDGGDGGSYLLDLEDFDELEEEAASFQLLDSTEYYDPIDPDASGPRHHHRHHLMAAAATVNVMSLKDAVGMTPLALLFRRYRQRVRAVISRIDQLHAHNPNQQPGRAALVSAMTVHVELGELWEKARRIIARLTQARLTTEEQLQQQQLEQETLHTLSATTAAAAEASSYKKNGPQESKEEEDHQFRAAAVWAAEKHGKREVAVPDDVLALPESGDDSAAVATEAADASTGRDGPAKTSGSEQGRSKGGGCSTALTATSTSRLPASCKAVAGKRRQFRIVHASVGLVGYGCPPEMIRLAISLHPHQVREMDEDGNLPLHIAVKSSSYLTSGDYAASNNDWNVDGGMVADDRSVRSAWSFFSTATISQTPHPFDKVIKMLLQHYPEGAMTPQGQTGQLPLTLAIQHGNRTWQDGIRTLLNAYPPALHSRKLFEPELYPFVLATLAAAAAQPPSMANSHPSASGGGSATGTPTALPPSSSPSSKQQRQEACARYTFYRVLRTKPEWLTPEGRNEEKRGI